MESPKIYWSVRFTTGFHKSFQSLCDLDKWRMGGFIRHIVYAKDPRKVFHYTKCHDCPPQIALFGISDDGLGHKGIETLTWLDDKTDMITFLQCRKVDKK